MITVDQVKKAEERLKKDFWNDAEQAKTVYETADSAYNILFSNTVVILSAIFNSVPIPVVKSKTGNSPTVNATCKVLQQVLTYLIDSGFNSSFENAVKRSLTTALVAGQGVVRLRYKAIFYQEEQEVEGETVQEEVLEQELITYESVDFDRFVFPKAPSWDNVDWVAFKVFMTKAMLRNQFGEAAQKILEEDSPDNGDKLYTVYEIWDKTTKKVRFQTDSDDTVLQEVDDPFQLKGFFPVVCPLWFHTKLDGRIPAPLYNTYRRQAKELAHTSERILTLTEALKVRGSYDGSCEELAAVLEAGDNEMIPIRNSQILQGRSTADALFFVPLEPIISALNQLSMQRPQILKAIYDITGISDIARGSTLASETLGAQKLKSQYGAVRLNDMQRLTTRYIVEILRLTGELVAKNFSIDSLKNISQITLLESEAQVEQAAIQGMLSVTSWEAVEQLLKSELKNILIDIETDSSIAATASADKQELSEMMNAIAQFMNGIAPIVSSGALPFEAAKALLLSMLKKFRLGSEVEDLFSNMQAPAPQQQDNGEQQVKMQELQLKAELDNTVHKNKMELLTAQHNMEMLKLQQELLTLKMKV